MERALNSLKIWLPVLLLIVSFSFTRDSFAEEDYVGDEVIVKPKEHVNPQSASFSFNNQGKHVIETYEDVNVVVLQLTSGESVEEAQDELESSPDVEYTEKNYVVRASLTPNDTYFRLQDYYGVIDAPDRGLEQRDQ